jgi:signal transduction histidine kinase
VEIILKDITRTQQFEKDTLRLAQLNLVGEMAASIVHEVRNPMTTVRGYLQLFHRNPKFESHLEQITVMIEELDRANSIITEFLSLAKNEDSQMKLGNLNSIITALFPLIQADVFSLGHNVQLESSDVPDILLDDKGIRQLILNLVRNAVEAMEQSGIVTIRTYCFLNTIMLEISDTGKGIPQELVNKLGTPFLTTKSNGTGLGLAVCYRIAKSHGAMINIATSEDGTTFSIIFQMNQ